MIEVLHASVIVLAITHVTTLALLAADLRRARPLGTPASVAFGVGAAVLGAAVASVYVPVWSAVLAGAFDVAIFVGYLAVRRHELRPVGVAAWSSFVLMTVAASVWGVRFVATMPVSTSTHALTWAALALVALSAPAAFIQIRGAWEPLMRTRWQRPADLAPEPWPRSRWCRSTSRATPNHPSSSSAPSTGWPGSTTPPSRSWSTPPTPTCGDPSRPTAPPSAPGSGSFTSRGSAEPRPER